MKVRITLTEELLGTKAANKDVFADFIASKAPSDDLRRQELDTAEHREEAGTTVFHRHPETKELIIWDYQMKGFLKESADIMRQCSKNEAVNPWKNAKRKFDNFVFVFPRMIPLGKSEADGVCERALRAETAQGPRTAVARSETVAAGTSFTCEIKLMPNSPVTDTMIRTCLDYGSLKGLGQWRNSGVGRFTWEELEA